MMPEVPSAVRPLLLSAKTAGAEMCGANVGSIRRIPFYRYPPWDYSERIARREFRTASTVTPTSAKTASHMSAIPKAPNSSMAAFIPMANTMFCMTMRIVMQNIVFAIGIKAAMLLLGAFGIADMWEAVFADVGVTVLAVLNSLRAMRSE